MRLYLVGVEGHHHLLNPDHPAYVGAEAEKCMHLLTSYYYLRDSERAQRLLLGPGRRFASFFLDSGAFSAKMKGTVIDLDAYSAFCAEHAGVVDQYASLDMIGDAAASARNLERMEAAGLRPVPVFHYGSDLRVLRHLVERYDRLALGGMVPVARRPGALREFLRAVFSIIGPGRRVHGFGMTNLALLEEFPFYSADSSTYSYGSKRSTVYQDNGTRALAFSTERRGPEAAKDARPETVVALYADDGRRWRERERLNVLTILAHQRRLTALWAARGVVWDDA